MKLLLAQKKPWLVWFERWISRLWLDHLVPPFELCPKPSQHFFWYYRLLCMYLIIHVYLYTYIHIYNNRSVFPVKYVKDHLLFLFKNQRADWITDAYWSNFLLCIVWDHSDFPAIVWPSKPFYTKNMLLHFTREMPRTIQENPIQVPSVVSIFCPTNGSQLQRSI